MEAETPESRPSRLSAIERHLMALSMAALCTLTMANVLVRYFSDFSFAFTEEISVVLMVIMTLVGASHAFSTNHHIAISYFVERKPAIRRASRKLAVLCSLVIFGLLLYYGSFMAWDDYQFEVTSPSLGVPQWWYSIWLPVLSLLIVARLIGLLFGKEPEAS